MRRALVVDDQACIRGLVKEVLEIWDDGIDVVEAENGVEALACLNGKTYDLIVCDINMPEMDGLGVLDKVREMQYTHDMPIIMLTANTDPKDITRALKKGATSYVTKPFNVKELLDALNTSAD